MERLLTDSSYRDELGLRGYEAYGRNWTAAVHLDRYLALIEEIAGKKEQAAMPDTPL